MCNEQDRIAFCIWCITDSHLSPTSSLIFFSTSFRTAPKDIHDDVILIDLVLRILVRQLQSLFKLSIFKPWTAHFIHSDLLAGLVNDRSVDSISLHLSCVSEKWDVPEGRRMLILMQRLGCDL